MSKGSFHVLHPTRYESVPLPITLYLSEEAMLDDEFTAEQAAAVLLPDLQLALRYYLEEYRKVAEAGTPAADGGRR